MVDVRARIAALEGNRPQLSAELARFLDLVWSNRAFFMDGVPRLCKQATLAGRGALRGVGIASEPARQDGRAISYGKSRTIAIFNALDEVLGDNHDWWTLRGPAAMAAKQDFIATVAVHLRRAGIDPAQVHI